MPRTINAVFVHVAVLYAWNKDVFRSWARLLLCFNGAQMLPCEKSPFLLKNLVPGGRTGDEGTYSWPGHRISLRRPGSSGTTWLHEMGFWRFYPFLRELSCYQFSWLLRLTRARFLCLTRSSWNDRNGEVCVSSRELWQKKISIPFHFYAFFPTSLGLPLVVCISFFLGEWPVAGNQSTTSCGSVRVL